MWFLYALLSAILASFRKVNDKHLSHKVHQLHLAWMMKAAALPVTGTLALVTGQIVPPHALSAAFWVSMLSVVLVIRPIDTALYLQSLKHGELSKTAPLVSLYPAVVLIIAAIFLGQIPSPAAIAAILIIVAGIFLLNTSRGSYNMLRTIWANRGTRLSLFSIFSVALCATVEVVAIANSSPLFFVFWAGIIGTVAQFCYAQCFARGQYRNPHLRLIMQSGTIQGTAGVFYFNAVATGPIAYVTAIRSLSATFAALLGVRTFDEGLGRRKLTALSLVTIGAITLGIKA